ncbi:hypothetical protein AC249_AIPGENE26657, partial [Exaiptasia diaphana]
MGRGTFPEIILDCTRSMWEAFYVDLYCTPSILIH